MAVHLHTFTAAHQDQFPWGPDFPSILSNSSRIGSTLTIAVMHSPPLSVITAVLQVFAPGLGGLTASGLAGHFLPAQPVSV
jgi:hypothetical protein